MKLISFIQALEGKSSQARLDQLIKWLSGWSIPFQLQKYASGTNLIVGSLTKPFIGIGTHFDIVPNCPGANDNASAIAVALGLLDHSIQFPLVNIGLTFFFFDEEETGLKGSEAYVNEYGVGDMLGLINLEMVGMGDRVALWPLNDLSRGKLLRSVETEANHLDIPTQRYDRMVLNTADHHNFRRRGLNDAFTLTAISALDEEVAHHYYRALEFEVNSQTLWEIMSQAPIFKHYHQPTDISTHLSEDSLQMVATLIWESVSAYDRQY